MIKFLIKEWFLTSAQARWMELVFIWFFVSLSTWILDNLDVILNWWTVDWKLFFITMGSTFWLWLTAAIRKYLRDLTK